MATKDELYTALRNADKAGDVEGARRLAAYIQSMPDSTPVADVAQPAAPALQASFPEQLGRQVLNAGAGAIRGAGSIGATLLWPIDAATDAIKGDRAPSLSGLITGKQPLSRNDERRQEMTNALRDLGADPESLAFQGGKLGAEVAGTLGVGGGLANALRAVPAVARVAAPIITAIESAGMTTGAAPVGIAAKAADIGIRAAGGAVTGGASAGLVSPSDAGTGAMIGGALPPAMKVAGAVGNAVGKGATGLLKHVLGMTTGVGAEPLAQAFKAGKAGNADFIDNMTGRAAFTDVLDRAKQGLQAMAAAKSAEYRSGMIPVKNDKTVLAFTGIDQALQDAAGVTAFKGQVKNDAAASVVAKMRDIVDEWRGLNPADFHTPEGMDALKQKLGGVLESVPFEQKTARLAAGKVYSAAKAEIEAQAPTYAAVMKDYADASAQISEIERALSLGNKASKDTAMRKLQSLMRNNVSTNYGNRLTLANDLEQKGGVELMPAIAGQALGSWTPRGLAGPVGGSATALSAVANPLALVALPFQSPRVMGNAAYGAGRLASGFQPPRQAAIPYNALSQITAPDVLEQMLYRAAPVGASASR
jgi:hypothetical protein